MANRYFTFSVLLAFVALACLGTLALPSFRLAPRPRVLVFTKTTGYVHRSIPAGVAAILKLGKEQGFDVDTTRDASRFTDRKLKPYSALIFLSTTDSAGNLLNAEQEKSFQRFIRRGGGYVGVHAASDAEFEWDWYGKLVGGYFLSHPEQQTATLRVRDADHPSTKHLPASWSRFDEWYNFKKLDPQLRVLLTIDEKSYRGGTHGDFHPVAWCHEFDGGRAFYTALGHTEASYSDPDFLRHLSGGIWYAIVRN